MNSHQSRGGRLQGDVIEIGYTEALRKHVTRHVVEAPPVTQRRLYFEHRRPRLLQECVAEALGAFFYVFCGISSTAALVLNSTSPTYAIFSSLQQIGLAFGLGIMLAITTCSPVSGGHFNPAVSLCHAIWKGFPWSKVPVYVFSQITGAFIAALTLMGCYWPQIQEVKTLDIKQHGTAVYGGGAASILCSFPAAAQTNQGYMFLQEFVGSWIAAIVIAACVDPANPFQSAVSVPYTVGVAYAILIWGFGSQAISLNAGRDLGARIVATMFFGKEAFTYRNFAWIPILVNLPGYVFGFGFYEYIFRDSLQSIQVGAASHVDGEAGIINYLNTVEATDSRHRVVGDLTEDGEASGKPTSQQTEESV